MFWKKKDKTFSPGDIVVCIDDRDWNGPNNSENIIFNKKYKIQSVCPTNCHGNSYDIGIRFVSDLFTRCNVCTKDLVGIRIHWAGHFRFRKASEYEAREYYKEHEEEISEKILEAISEENYEEAARLKKIIEQ